MSLTASLPGLEGRLSELVDRLDRQEETTRRLEATLTALARLPDGSRSPSPRKEELVVTPGTSSSPTPVDVPWPARRLGFLPKAPSTHVPLTEPDTTDSDVLWAAAGFVPDPLIGLDAAGRVRVWNPAAEAVFGWLAPDVIGFPAPFLPDDRRAEQTQLLAAACGGESVRDVPTIRKKKDGTLVRVRISAAGHAGGAAFVVKPEPAEPAGHLRPNLLAVGVDSTPLLAGMKRAVSAVVHDLNNLFTVVCSGSESLIERLSPGDPRRTDSEMVHAAGLHAARLVRQLAGLTTDAGPPPARADVNAVIRDMAPVLRGLLGTKRDLILDPAAPTAVVAVDPSRIGQVLLNLAANARDALTAGGTVTVSTRVNESAEVVLAVRDTGPGIEPRVRTRMFERNVSTKSDGRGIGLATVADVVKQAGGRIEVETAPGAGTVFLLYLPQADARDRVAARAG